MATQSSILALENPHGQSSLSGLQSMGLQRVGHNSMLLRHFHRTPELLRKPVFKTCDLNLAFTLQVGKLRLQKVN